jgi:hypothetical protein
MKCEEVVGLLMDARRESDRDARRAAVVHLSACEDCRDALRAVQAMHVEREAPVPRPSPGAFERAMAKATRRSPLVVSLRRPTFWWGAGAGFAAAASLAIAWLFVSGSVGPPGATASVPGVTLALNETRDLSIAVDSPVALAGAQIRVVLNGAIGLAGFGGQKELHWSTDLAAGVNQLTLPVVALGADGGQLTVEVLHGERRRIFIVDVRTTV